MLPLEILLSSLDIGVDRVGSRLPLQGRCACLRLDLDPPLSCVCVWVLGGGFVLNEEVLYTT